MKFKSLALAAAAALVLAACGGGGGDGKPAIDADYHIKGTVAGTVLKVTADIGGGPQSNGKLDLSARDDNYAWGLGNIPNAKGTYQCEAPQEGSYNYLNIDLGRRLDGVWTGYQADTTAGSSCSVTVEAVSDTEASGTFTATVRQTYPSTDAPVLIKDIKGSFRVPKNGRIRL